MTLFTNTFIIAISQNPHRFSRLEDFAFPLCYLLEPKNQYQKLTVYVKDKDLQPSDGIQPYLHTKNSINLAKVVLFFKSMD